MFDPQKDECLLHVSFRSKIGVALSQKGNDILQEYYQLHSLGMSLPEPDSHGYVWFEMWMFMRIFGNCMVATGRFSSFESDRFLIKF